MKSLLAALILLASGPLLAFPAAAQTTVAVHQAAPAAAKPTPAKAVAASIIPGSPLAALTGADAAPTPAANTPDPFGTDSLGLSIMNKVTADAQTTIGDFVKAVQRSTELTPVIRWLHSFATNQPERARFADAVMGLILTILPALLAEGIIRFALLRPKAALIRYAIARRAADFPDAPATETEDDGLDKAERGDLEVQPRKISAIAWLRRLGLALTYICLALLPILAFAAITGGLLGTGLIATRATRLIITGAGNAYLFWRFVSEISRFLFAPHAAELRLIHTTDRRARWIVRAVAVIVITVAAGAFLGTSAEILGLSPDGSRVLFLLVALAVHIELAVLIWQSRKIVARWIRGKPNEARTAIGIRNRLAGIWHFIALFYVLALWIAYAGGVHNAFGLLLRIVLVFIGAVITARLVWFGITTALDRLLDDDGEQTRAHPTLRARIRAYNHLLKLVIRVILTMIVLALMLQGWGVNIIPWLLSDPLSRSLINAFISIIITIAIALTLWEISNGLINARIDYFTKEGKTRRASRLRTLLPMLKATLGVLIFLTAALICLSKIGVNLVPLLAVSGVAGIAIGFGSQKLVQDIITGLFLLLEDAMQVGDTVTLASMTGTVERLSIRTIRLRGGDGSINIIPFSAVTTVTNMTRDFGYAQISIQVGYEEDLQHVTDVLMDIGHKMRAEPKWGAQMRDDLQIFGLDQFGASGLVITGQIRTGPGQHWAVRREFYARVKDRFEAEHIDMPYTYLPPAPPRAAPVGDGEEASKQGQGTLPPGAPAKAEPPAAPPLQSNSGREGTA
jgi:small conductance mechanosensitive channel